MATPEQNNCPSGSPAVVVVTVVVAMVTHVGGDVTVVFGDIVVLEHCPPLWIAICSSLHFACAKWQL